MFPNSLYSLPFLAALHSPVLAFSGDNLSLMLHDHPRVDCDCDFVINIRKITKSQTPRPKRCEAEGRRIPLRLMVAAVVVVATLA